MVFVFILCFVFFVGIYLFAKSSDNIMHNSNNTTYHQNHLSVSDRNAIRDLVANILQHPSHFTLYNIMNSWNEQKLALLFTGFYRVAPSTLPKSYLYLCFICICGAVAAFKNKMTNKEIITLFDCICDLLLKSYSEVTSMKSTYFEDLRDMIKCYFIHVKKLSSNDIAELNAYLSIEVSDDELNIPLWSFFSMNLELFKMFHFGGQGKSK